MCSVTSVIMRDQNGRTCGLNSSIHQNQVEILFQDHLRTAMAGIFMGRIEIVEQPMQKFRFRYGSEQGSHGCLTGATTGTNKRTKKYPSIKIHDLQEQQVSVQVSLYTKSHLQKGERMLHVHELKGKNCEDGIWRQNINLAESGQVVEIPNLYIQHNSKKMVKDILETRYLEKRSQELGGEALDDATKQQLVSQAATDAMHMKKELNSVVLCFEVFLPYVAGLSEHLHLCQPVYSQPIENIKSSEKGDLVITRKDKTAGSCLGNEEVFILCEKVDKKNIKVRFYEEGEESDRWIAYGDFGEEHVHHQYAIVFRTPPYRDTNITKPVKVWMDLYRPSDHAVSICHEFTYYATDRVELRRKKAKRVDVGKFENFSDGQIAQPGSSTVQGADNRGNSTNLHLELPSSSSGVKSEETDAPSTAEVTDCIAEYPDYCNPYANQSEAMAVRELVARLQCEEIHPTLNQLNRLGEDDSQDELSAVGLVPHGEMMELSEAQVSTEFDLDLLDMKPEWYGEDDVESDGPPIRKIKPDPDKVSANLVGRGRSGTSGTIEAAAPETKSTKRPPLSDMEIVYRLAVQTAKSLQDYARTSKIAVLLRMMQHLIPCGDQNGDNAIHLSVIYNQPESLSHLVPIASTLKSQDPVNMLNDMIQTPLHIAAHMAMPNMIKSLLLNGANPNLLDRHGDTALHMAAEHGNVAIIKALLSKDNYKSKAFKEQFPALDLMNYNGYAPLHLAVLAGSLDCVSTLVGEGVDINVQDLTSGRTALHLAVEKNNIPIIRYLVKTNIEIDMQTFGGNTALHIACASNSEEVVSLLMNAEADPLIENYEPADPVDDDEEEEEEQKQEQPATGGKGDGKEEDDSDSEEVKGCTSLDLAQDNDKILSLLRYKSGAHSTSAANSTVITSAPLSTVITPVPNSTVISHLPRSTIFFPQVPTHYHKPTSATFPSSMMTSDYYTGVPAYPLPSRSQESGMYSMLGIDNRLIRQTEPDDDSEILGQLSSTTELAEDSGLGLSSKNEVDMMDSDVKEKLIECLDKSKDKGWKQLMRLMNKDFFESTLENDPSPSNTLLGYIETYAELRNYLSALDNKEASSVFEEYQSSWNRSRQPPSEMTGLLDDERRLIQQMRIMNIQHERR